MGAFGQKLKEIREKKKISLDEVALSTKIGTRMLRAIEEEHFDQLPGGIFNKGFIRAYARHLGLNEDEAVADYLAAVGASTPQPPPAVGEPQPAPPEIQPPVRSSGLGSWGKLAAALLLLAVALGFWNLRSRHDAPKSAAVSAEPRAPSVPAPKPPKRESAAAQPVRAAENATPTTAGIPAPASGTEPEVTTKVVSFHILIRAREDSWVSVIADGKTIMQDTLLAEGQRYIAAEKEILVKAGNVGGLEFWFNGQKLPLQGDPDQVKTLTFDPRGLVTPTAKVEAPEPAGVTQP